MPFGVKLNCAPSGGPLTLKSLQRPDGQTHRISFARLDLCCGLVLARFALRSEDGRCVNGEQASRFSRSSDS